MRLLALELILSLLDARGHIPRFDDFRPSPVTSAPAGALRALAAAVAVFAVLSLAVWATVWLAIQLF